jgi:hypothetical protein
VTAALLRLASWIVPRHARAEWLAEWRAELAFIAQSDPQRGLAFTLGAIPDARCLRRDERHPRAPILASPVHCLAILAALAALAALCQRVGRDLSAGLVTVRPHAGPDTLTFDQYRALAASSEFASLEFKPAGLNLGHVVAKLAHPLRRHVSVQDGKGRRDIFDCIPVAPRNRLPVTVLMLGIALIVLPATTAMDVGRHHRARARLFLVAKLALALTAVYYAAHILAPAMLGHGLLIGFILAIRWALNDQRRRCPVCLRRVTNPVSFGCLSHTLLDWHGAEFVCPEGHGMLQVSATTASPYAPLHWVRL